ncbi:polyamine oxidase 1 [Beta vulgaris subsp. vulgaris]|uniref:polyamine oxidase 1 n=1 Tax=Beta vulgaris subsp. vulgaris TaxID=3555 RepID=UPI0025470DEB|nr:polyamine oxidase 1 [Beta vulgaris subsp. vulgaris]
MKVLSMMNLFFFFPFLLTITSALSPSPAVIIVGAGMSGISAAKRLHDAGIKDILILEATNRIGGRIKKTNFAGYTVEMGANWLHGLGGPKRNPLYEMSKQIHLKKFFSDFSNISFNTYKQEGGLYKDDEVDAAIEKVDETLDYGEKYSNLLNLEKNKEDDMSILALERLRKTDPRTRLEKMIDFFTFDGEQSEAPRISSLKHVLPLSESEQLTTLFGENAYFVADSRGFESLVHLIAKQFLSYKNGAISDPRLKFNQVVREIDQSKGGVTVKTENGMKYKAELVIMSPSIGVLQSDLISFRPQLPVSFGIPLVPSTCQDFSLPYKKKLWKRRAISDFNIGIYTKIFLKFPRAFWPTGNGTEFFLYVHERRGYYGIWQHLENEYPGSNIMFATATDDESIRVEQQSDEETKAEAMEVLRKMFGKNIPEATHIMIPRWKSDRFYRGCFTNWPVGYPQKRHDQLRAPIGKIYFTGEHTHPQLYGYADGAYFAGADTAKDAIQCLKNKICRAQDLVFYEQIKHVEVDCHFVRDAITEGLISPSYVSGKAQLANNFTKALGKPRFFLDIVEHSHAST